MSQNKATTLRHSGELRASMNHELSSSSTQTQTATWRHRNDLVGKRVLCIPKTFEVAAPSPAQLSSRFWSSRCVRNMEDVNAPRWCQLHHHHQANQSELIQLMEEQLARNQQHSGTDNNADNDARLESQPKRLKKRPAGQPSKSGSNQSCMSYSVMRSQTKQLIKSTPAAQSPDAESECDQLREYNSADKHCELCDTSGLSQDTSEEARRRQINSLPWRLGTIRAVSDRNLTDKNLSIMIEFDLLDWKLRDWYQVRDDPSQSEADNSLRFEVDDSEASEVGTISSSDANLGKDARRIENAKSASTSACAAGSSSKQIAKSGRKVDQSSSSPACGVKQESGQIPRGSFSVLLIENSICCLERKHSPVGRHKLWPALVGIKFF